MPSLLGFQSIGGSLYIRQARDVGPATAAAAPAPVVNNNARQDLLTARAELIDLFHALERVASKLNVNSRLRLDLPDAQSSSSLGIDMTTTAAMLSSSAEINASAHSFSPFGPEWIGGSDALITIGGEYDGSDGSGDLSFESRRNGTHGEDNLRIRVRNPLGNIISNLNIQASHELDREYSLNNGLFITLGAGDLVNGDTTGSQVFENIGSVFDPSRPLGGIRNENPNFQYYESPNTLAPVIDGSFILNGASISVSAAESMNDVLTRINQSSAGVTASFNAITDQVEFVQNTTGSVPTIDLQGDSSNLVISAKLDTAVVVPGIDPESQVALSSVGAFSAVQSGDLVINGTSITIDADNDSLESVVARIDASGADVKAVFDPQTRRVRIEANDPSSILEIDSNGTNLFAALKIPEGRVDPAVDGNGVSRRRSYEIADAIEEMAAELNALFDNQSFLDGAANVASIRDNFDSVVSSLFESIANRSSSVFGMKFDQTGEARGNGRYASVDRRNFTQNLQRRGDEVKQLLTGTGDDVGFIGRLATTALSALRDINSELGISGSVIDTFA